MCVCIYIYIYCLFVCARAWRIGVGKSLISLIINIKEVFVNGIICTTMARRKKKKKKIICTTMTSLLTALLTTRTRIQLVEAIFVVFCFYFCYMKRWFWLEPWNSYKGNYILVLTVTIKLILKNLLYISHFDKSKESEKEKVTFLIVFRPPKSTVRLT